MSRQLSPVPVPVCAAVCAAACVAWAGTALITAAPGPVQAASSDVTAPVALAPPVAVAPPAVVVPPPLVPPPPASEAPPEAVRRVASWAHASGDAGRRPFVVIDKLGARVWVFDAQGQVQGQSPVLLGLAHGDDSVPGIGERPIAQIRPHERTTPAGRFVAEPGLNHQGEDIVWIDYDAAVSMHRVRPTDPKERRLQRLASPTVDDNRISYGCVNVPAAFYDATLKPLFANGPKLVYVLPDTKQLAEVFSLQLPVTAAVTAKPAATPVVAPTASARRE